MKKSLAHPRVNQFLRPARKLFWKTRHSFRAQELQSLFPVMLRCELLSDGEHLPVECGELTEAGCVEHEVRLRKVSERPSYCSHAYLPPVFLIESRRKACFWFEIGFLQLVELQLVDDIPYQQVAGAPQRT